MRSGYILCCMLKCAYGPGVLTHMARFSPPSSTPSHGVNNCAIVQRNDTTPAGCVSSNWETTPEKARPMRPCYILW